MNSGGTDSGNSVSAASLISADGRYVVFVSYASDLVGTDTNGTGDVFVRDRQTGMTELVSVNSGGTDSGNSVSSLPHISADGSTVVFASFASDLVGTDTNSAQDVFVSTSDRCATETPTNGCKVDGLPNQLCQADDTGQTVIGTNGDDVIFGGAGADTLRGQAGNDLLCGFGENDVLIGGSGDDELRGDAGNDVLRGDAGNDTLAGGADNDTLIGGGGTDDIQGEGGDDRLIGNAGDDTLDGGDDTDVANGGAGTDTCLNNETEFTCP